MFQNGKRSEREQPVFDTTGVLELDPMLDGDGAAEAEDPGVDENVAEEQHERMGAIGLRADGRRRKDDDEDEGLADDDLDGEDDFEDDEDLDSDLDEDLDDDEEVDEDFDEELPEEEEEV